MKDIIIYMPYLYCYLSGILVSWSICTSISMFSLLKHNVRVPTHLGSHALTLVICWTIFILCSLFVFPEFTAKYLNVLIGLELISIAVLFYLRELLTYVNYATFDFRTKKLKSNSLPDLV